MSDDEARLHTAYHETGHAISAALFGFDVETVSIRPGKHYAGIATLVDAPVNEIAEIRQRSESGGALLSRWGATPVPLFDPDVRRPAELSIMVALAGPAAEILAGPVPGGRFVDDFDEATASAVARGITERQAAHLISVDRPDLVSDDDMAIETARTIAGEKAAGALVAWLQWETRRLVTSELFVALSTPLVELLLRNEVLSGDAVVAIVRRQQDQTLKVVAHRKEET
jgi:hypothetical protein